VTLVSIVEDSGPRIITQAELLQNANDAEGNALTATSLSISSGLGNLVDNGDGTWTYNPALNDDTSVTFTYNISDSFLSSVGTANLNITGQNDPPTNAPVTLVAILEDSGARIITQAELLANATGPNLVAQNLAISSGLG
jgi:large repetitive protein